jgi:hypothetical protein
MRPLVGPCLSLCLLLLTPRAAEATPSCPKGAHPPLSAVPASLTPGTWLPAGAFDTFGGAENPLPNAHLGFQESIALGSEKLEVKGLVESDPPGGRGTVLILAPVENGSCVIDAWQTPAGSRFVKLSLLSVWRPKDGRRAFLLVEASGTRPTDDGSPPIAKSVVLAIDSTRARKVFDANAAGLAFAPQPGTLALLGAGAPLLLGDAGEFRPRTTSRSPATAAGACPKSGGTPLGDDASDPSPTSAGLARDRWIPSDAASSLYPQWSNDDRAKVAFRKLLTSGKEELEVVGITGSDAALVFLAPAAKGFCVLNVWYQSWGGNGVTFQPASWWQSKDERLTILQLDVASAYHHGADADDAQSEEQHLAIAIDGLRVRNAAAAEQALASARRKSR